ARWQQIKHKAEAYSEYLGDRQASLLAHLAEQKQRLAAKVMELTAAKTAAKETDSAGDTQPPLFADRPLFPGATAAIGDPTAADDVQEDTDQYDTDQYDTETGEFQLAGN
ncbi:unnamed protein product, partial [marine sediment metagenome]